MKKKKQYNLTSLSPTRKKLFTFITISIPFLLLFLCETGLHIANYSGDLSLFIPTPTKDSIYLGLNPDIGKRYFYNDTFSPTPRKDLFLKEKPENCFRIFVLGGSTTVGFPYGNNLTFPRIIHRELAYSNPDKHIEVINCAMTAINSYSLLDFMDEILAQKPDLILVYAGHNEFYGALGVSSMESFGRNRWLVKTLLEFRKFKTFLLIRDGILTLLSQIFNSKEGYKDPTQTVMSRIVKDQSIPYNSALYKKGLKQFENNMRDILHKTSNANIPVILSELVSNVKNQPPFLSINSDSLPSANDEYLEAKKAFDSNNFSLAKKHLYRAKDYDALRFRASEDMNDILHKLTEQFEYLIVPLKNYFEAASPNGLIGSNLMWEHLHPNMDGYFLMADAFLNEIEKCKLLSNDNKNQKTDSIRKNWGFTKLDSIYATLMIKQLEGSWPFVETGTPNQFMTHFKPQNIYEQIVFEIIANGKGTLEEGHIKLAQKYINEKHFTKAIHEYEALVYTVPQLDLFYQPYIQLLVQLSEYDKALAVLNEALFFQDSAFIHKWLGQIYLAQQQTTLGINHLEKAFDKSPQDDQIVYNLSRAFYSTKNFEKGDDYFNQLKRLNVKAEQLEILQEFRERVK